MFLEIKNYIIWKSNMNEFKRNWKGMRNCEEIRCAIHAIERPLSSCRNYETNPTRTIFIYWRPFIFHQFR